MSKRTTAKKKIVLKDFSGLKVEDRIDSLAMSLLKVVHRGERETAFEPRKGTQLHRVWAANKLDIRQQMSWRAFRRDCDMAEGKSGGVTIRYDDVVDSDGTSVKVPVAFMNNAQRRIEHILLVYLDRHDRALLADLYQDDLNASKKLTLEIIGVIRSGYKNENDARVAGIVNIQSLLSRLASYYCF